MLSSRAQRSNRFLSSTATAAFSSLKKPDAAISPEKTGKKNKKEKPKKGQKPPEEWPTPPPPLPGTPSFSVVKEDMLLKDLTTLKPKITPEGHFGRNNIGNIGLPVVLQSAMAKVLQGTDKGQVHRDVEKLYRAMHSTGFGMKLTKKNQDGTLSPQIEPHTMEYSKGGADAFVAGRFPATYSVVYHVLNEIAKRVPTFHPNHILDYGTGPGTAIWAAREVWGENIHSVGIESSDSFRDITASIAKYLKKEVDLRAYMSPSVSSEHRPELVVCSFNLEEMDSDAIRQAAIEQLWKTTSDMLVLIERGTPIGYKIIENARDWILSTANPDSYHAPKGSLWKAPNESGSRAEEAKIYQPGAHVVAPCSHDSPCPMKRLGHRWCHFSVTLQRPKIMMSAKLTKSNIEDVKYSYLVIRKGPRPEHTGKEVTLRDNEKKKVAKKKRAETTEEQQPELPDLNELSQNSFHWPRVIAPPMKRGGHIIFDLCSPQGIIERSIVSKAKSYGTTLFKESRKAKWGDLWPHEPVQQTIVREPQPMPVGVGKTTKPDKNRSGVDMNEPFPKGKLDDTRKSKTTTRAGRK
ncbi:mitochondrial small ribosomal subunit Rsm22-domain-containing protein [Cladochytrium replicatum]|nr:mitochondrial small ribosomal subunit Rsm22-domain-containing protein [Cladochytrium replicatum]